MFPAHYLYLQVTVPEGDAVEGHAVGGLLHAAELQKGKVLLLWRGNSRYLETGCEKRMQQVKRGVSVQLDAFSLLGTPGTQNSSPVEEQAEESRKTHLCKRGENKIHSTGSRSSMLSNSRAAK